MLYDLKKPEHVESFVEKVNRVMSEEAIVELTKKNQRTPKQNKYLHLLLQWFAMETGYTPAYVKRFFFKITANPDLFIYEIEGPLGKGKDIRSSADLSTEEMTEAIERFRNWSAATANIHLPAPEDQAFLAYIEVEASRYYYK